jgi:hypothetical protein
VIDISGMGALQKPFYFIIHVLFADTGTGQRAFLLLPVFMRSYYRNWLLVILQLPVSFYL